MSRGTPRIGPDLQIDRRHIRQSIQRIRKSQEANDDIQERIQVSLELIERTRRIATGKKRRPSWEQWPAGK
jgi:hypothetical protein